MRKENVYTSQNIISLVAVFIVIFWLLYSLASFLHESKKIHDEIEAIRVQNEKNLQAIEEKKRQLSYLRTPEHIDKEAKMQMGKKQPGEQVLVFIEEKLPILPPETEQRNLSQVNREEVPIVDKWKWLFLGKR
jgi:cell division protein FtsB